MSAKLLRPSAVAKMYGVTSQCIRNAIKRGDLEAVLIGNRFMVPETAINKFVKHLNANQESETKD